MADPLYRAAGLNENWPPLTYDEAKAAFAAARLRGFDEYACWVYAHGYNLREWLRHNRKVPSSHVAWVLPPNHMTGRFVAYQTESESYEMFRWTWTVSDGDGWSRQVFEVKQILHPVTGAEVFTQMSGSGE